MKFIFLTCCLIAGHLAAYENEYAEKMPQNADRYQMQVVIRKDDGRTEIYLLDKENGTIWWTSGFNPYYRPWVKLNLLQLPAMQESE